MIADLKEKLESLEQSISSETQQKQEVDASLEIITNTMLEQKQQYTTDLPDSVSIIDDVILINDQPITVDMPIDESQDVLVHCTDFFPKNKTILSNYDGNKPFTYSLTYQGVTKQVQYISHRHTLHFVQNNTVESTPDGFGTWEQPKYIIIEPTNRLKDQIIASNAAESWTYGSVALGEKPILLVRKDAYDDIPKEELSNFNVMMYEGDYAKCTRTALRLCGVKIKERTDSAGHSNSLEMAVEASLEFRHMATNYIKDNSWDGKSDISLTEEELFALYEMSIDICHKAYAGATKACGASSIPTLKKLTGVPNDFAKFMISLGIKKTEINIHSKKTMIYIES